MFADGQGAMGARQPIGGNAISTRSCLQTTSGRADPPWKPEMIDSVGGRWGWRVWGEGGRRKKEMLLGRKWSTPKEGYS